MATPAMNRGIGKSISTTCCACFANSALLMSKGCMFCPRSLHYDFAGHLRMNRAEVGISSRFAEGEGELLVRVEHFGLEDLRIVRADHGVRDVIAIRPCDCGSYRHS